MIGNTLHGVDPRIVEAFERENGFPLDGHLILLALVGSHSHGTYIPKDAADGIDDVDYMGIVIPPARHLIGLTPWEHWTWQHEELDVVLYSLHKAATLMLKGNPNILGLLWLDTYKWIPHPGRALARHREAFASASNVYTAFVGYAQNQLSKMTTFDEARAAEYDAARAAVVAHGIDPARVAQSRGDVRAFLLEIGADNLPADSESVALQFRALHRKYFSGYMGEKRRAMVRRHGYDTKNAAHLIRLLRMGNEYLHTGVMHVARPDRDELMAIKRGEWPLARVHAEANQLFEDAHLAFTRSPLPLAPDRARVEALVIDLHRQSMEYVG